MAAQPKPIRRRDPDYLDWIRRQPCVVTGIASSSVDAHHVRKAGHGGVGTKPDDRRALPLHHDYHREYHDIGRAAFELKYGLDLEALIVEHARKYPAGKSKQDPSVRVRPVHPSVVAHRFKCRCGRNHTIPSSKTTINNRPGGTLSFSYYCPIQKQTQEATRRTA